MLLPRTNIERKLSSFRDKSEGISSWRAQVEAVFTKEEEKEKNILAALSWTVENTDFQNHFNFDLLVTHRIYHIDHIARICIDYRLRFLDTKYFKGKIPSEALSKIKALEKEHHTILKGYKIIAPSKLFKLENENDPLLFAPMGNDYYYLIHKWGKDLHPLRKIMMWPFKNFENLLLLTFLVSIVFTAMIPNGLFTNQPTTVTIFLLELFFMFKSVAAIVLFYGFAKGKNFSPAIWRSKYYNT